MSQVEVLLTVGKLDASLALLTTEDHHVIEFPTVLLPDDVKAGSIVKLSVSQTLEEEKRQRELFRELQAKILEKYGTHRPKPPVLKVVNVTQTSCVLAWDPLELGSASLKSLILYRQGVRSTVIPCPLKTNTTKISGLSVDTDYEFELKLTTTSGQLWSEKVKMHTHKMTDMSGITVCLGPLDPLQSITGAQIAQSLAQIGARPLQRQVAIDTTHFVTNDIDNDDDPELAKAKNSNIPIVRPEWVRASEIERRIVGVRGFYLDADQGILKSYQFPPASEEFKAKYAKLKAGVSPESSHSNKELPDINAEAANQISNNEKNDSTTADEPKAIETSAEQNGPDAESIEEIPLTGDDLKEAAEPPADELDDDDVAPGSADVSNPVEIEIPEPSAEGTNSELSKNEEETEAADPEVSRQEETFEAATNSETSRNDEEAVSKEPEVSKEEEAIVSEEPGTSKKEKEAVSEEPEISKKEEETVPEEPEIPEKEEETIPEEPEIPKKEEETVPEEPEVLKQEEEIGVPAKPENLNVNSKVAEETADVAGDDKEKATETNDVEQQGDIEAATGEPETLVQKTVNATESPENITEGTSAEEPKSTTHTSNSQVTEEPNPDNSPEQIDVVEVTEGEEEGDEELKENSPTAKSSKKKKNKKKKNKKK